MKQALKVVNEINKLKIEISISNSEKLITDRSKKIRTLIKDLKEYCSYKGINYNKLIKS
ncbi:MAG: hypothetical protein J6R47_03510 [Acholeplasmatales bacterium]|nr:hypothetical protein [Acholeplasmatales bacterium]